MFLITYFVDFDVFRFKVLFINKSGHLPRVKKFFAYTKLLKRIDF